MGQLENKDFPAFPCKTYREFADDFKNGFQVNEGINPTGLTKREYFAIECLKGLLSNSAHANQIHNVFQGVSIALGYADELGKALTTPNPLEKVCPHCGCNKWSDICLRETNQNDKLCKNCNKEFN